MSFNGRMAKPTKVYPRHGILLSNKEEQTIDTCNNLDGPQGSHAGWEKPNEPNNFLTLIKKKKAPVLPTT